VLSGGTTKRRRVVLIAAAGVALALPARAYAVDHAVLILAPTKLAAHPAWNVHARIVDAAYIGQEIFGVSLTRSFLKGRAEELHEFAPASQGTFTFDGQRGRWEGALGVVAVMRLRSRWTSQPREHRTRSRNLRIAGVLLPAYQLPCKGRSCFARAPILQDDPPFQFHRRGYLQSRRPGRLHPACVDRRYELSEIADAFRYLGEGHAQGKVVLTV
jgi:hypothetical protein